MSRIAFANGDHRGRWDSVTIPTFESTSRSSGSTAIPASLSFYYAAISSVWIWYEASIETLRAYLDSRTAADDQIVL